MSDDDIKDGEGTPLSGSVDLGAWEPQAPPADFAERVLARVRAEEARGPESDQRSRESNQWSHRSNRRSHSRRVGLAAGGAAVLALAAAMVLKIGSAPPSHGEAIAKDRLEVSIGSRARAVLEPGARVTWDGDDVVQANGDVFYRVEPGARFQVHTAAGDVEVKGTCFAVKVRGDGEGDATKENGAMQKRDVKVGTVGAVMGALAFVAVYEGKVAVSHASERIDLAAGENAQMGKDGIRRSTDLGEGQKSFDAKLAEQVTSDPLAKANENLVAQVAEYRNRLELIAQQRSELEEKLKKSEEKLASQTDGGSGRNRSEYDLDKDDWAALAREGSVKYRVPCMRPDMWTFAPDKLNKLGLAPSDAEPLRDAYSKSYDRIWAQIRPLCIAELGTSPDIVDKIGPNNCPHLIYDIESAKNHDAATEALTEAAEVRAGLRPEPGPNDKVNNVLRMFLILTSANGSFEGDLTKSFGPEEAHRLAFADGMCNWNSKWGGGKKREPEPEAQPK